MTTQLGRLQPQRLSVIARTASMRHKNRDVPVDQIGCEFGVDYVYRTARGAAPDQRR